MVRNKISQTANARETIQSGEHRHSAWTEGSRNIPTPSHIPHRAQVATLCCILRESSNGKSKKTCNKTNQPFQFYLPNCSIVVFDIGAGCCVRVISFFSALPCSVVQGCG